MKRACSAIVLAGLAACASAGPGSPGAAPDATAPGSAREDRVLLTAFDVIPAVAASSRTVYVATADGIGILDREFGRWLPPVTRAQGYPGGPVSAIAADPMDDGVWVAVAGVLVYYRPMLDQLQRTVVPGAVDQIVFDQRDLGAGAYVHGAGGWSLASRTGFVMPVDPARVPPPQARTPASTLREVYGAFPSLQATGPMLTRDAQLRSWPIIAGTKTPNQSEVWLGTRGGGLFRVDPLFQQGEQYPFGPLETGVAALAPAANGVWMAGVGRSLVGRGGLTFASADLQHWEWLEGPIPNPLAGVRANRLAVRESAAWVATDRGLVLLDTRDPSRALRWSAGNGLPSDEAFAVAATGDGAWVGTARGLAFVSNAGEARTARAESVSAPLVQGSSVRALLLAGDTLWVGSDAGLLLVRGASPDSAPRRVGIADARLRRPIRALAGSDSLIAVATESDLVVLDVARGALAHAFDGVNASLVRGITAVAMDARTIWLVGNGGALAVARATGVSRFLPAPGALPAEAFDVVLDPSYAWIATRAGVLRLRRLPDGEVR